MPRASVDIAAFYGALDRQRQAEGLSWRGLGRELEIPASTFTRLSQGAGPDVDAFAVLLHWLGMPVSAFLDPPQGETSREDEQNEPWEVIGAQLRNDPGLTPEAAGAIEHVVRVVYQTLRIERNDSV
jgi:transcriptional regulator with XRE-family HTH domain